MKTLKLNLIVLLMLTMNFAQSQEKAQMKQMQTEKTAFACPMQCEGEKTYDKAGSCPICKMDLKKVEMKMAETYSCPMHADVKSDKPGSCSKCGMDLKKVENAKKPACCAGMKKECNMNHDKMDKTYSCPMHADITSDKPGVCPNCGMDMKKMEMKK
ncbi:MAG: heavy metal-binding domain-containing protein [Lutibacter sp.]|nr:heavy metal-binding domain-containing protein [Lutibacter sp.]MDT8416704.1 heavy metal-binding domain-containing protein [Lutibacter sp.]